MILTVGNIKGGVGKTTLALNLAIARAAQGRDVLLIDGDEQQTALTFTELREVQLGQLGYTAVALTGASLRSQVRQLAPKYDDLIIDAGGRDNGSLRAALVVSDALLAPVQPRSFDIWAIDQMSELVQEARELNERLQAYLVLNAADAQGRDNEEALAVLRARAGFTLLPFTIGRRKAFPNAAALGRSVLEQSPRDPKATQELMALLAALYDDQRTAIGTTADHPRRTVA
jgi:chromosome partitioning protein